MGAPRALAQTRGGYSHIQGGRSPGRVEGHPRRQPAFRLLAPARGFGGGWRWAGGATATTIESAQYVEGGRSVLALVGELDLASVESLRHRLDAWRRDVGDQPAVLDLSGVRFIDTGNLREIVAVKRRWHTGSTFRLQGVD